MKKKIDGLVDLYKQTTEVNDLINALNPKWKNLQERLEEMNKYHWLTGENILKRKKVSIKSNFSCITPTERVDYNLPISSLNISYVGEGNANAEGNGLCGIYLGLHLKTKTGSRIDIGIACNDGCLELPMLHFERSRGTMHWETCTIEFKNAGDRETIIEFCESALIEVNKKLATGNLKPLKKMFQTH